MKSIKDLALEANLPQSSQPPTQYLVNEEDLARFARLVLQTATRRRTPSPPVLARRAGSGALTELARNIFEQGYRQGVSMTKKSLQSADWQPVAYRKRTEA